MNDEEKKEIDAIITSIEDAKTAKIRLMQELQKKYGYLHEDHMRYVAERIGTSYTDFYGIATFYAQFNLSPVGRHTIYVCEGTSCHVKGGKRLLNKIREQLNVKVNETTEDKRFTLKIVRCLGCCGISPTIMVNYQTYGRVRLSDLPGILSRFE